MLQRPAHKSFLFVAVCAFLFALPVHAQQIIDLSIKDARTAGLQSLASGKPEIARAIAQGLLQRDPKDVQALLLLAAAQVALGTPEQAISNAKRGLSLANNARDRFSAARIIASAHQRDKHYTRAELWLRRALQYAPDERLKNIATHDFRVVKQQNPLTINLSFSAAPSSNINNGSSNDKAWLFGLPFVLNPTAQALSGTEFSIGANFRYRFQETATTATDFGFRLFSQSYALSPATRAVAPTAKASDYAFVSAEASLTRKILSDRNRTRRDFKLAIGQTWYGGAGLNQYLSFNFNQEHTATAKRSYTFGGSAQISQRINSTTSPLYTVGTNAAVILRGRKGSLTKLGVNLWHAGGQSRSSEFTSLGLGLMHRFAATPFGADIALNFGINHRAYPYSVYNTAGRQDTTLSAGLSLVFKNADIYGFSPVLNLSARKTSSNIGLFDSKSLSAGIGIQSTF